MRAEKVGDFGAFALGRFSPLADSQVFLNTGVADIPDLNYEIWLAEVARDAGTVSAVTGTGAFVLELGPVFLRPAPVNLPVLAGRTSTFRVPARIAAEPLTGEQLLFPFVEAPPTATATFGSAASTDYRATFFAAHPELRGKVIVHHAVPQRSLVLYPTEVSEAEIHSLENLRGIPKVENSRLHLSEIAREWNDFYKVHPNASKAELLRKAADVDAKYGSQFHPPRGGS